MLPSRTGVETSPSGRKFYGGTFAQTCTFVTDRSAETEKTHCHIDNEISIQRQPSGLSGFLLAEKAKSLLVSMTSVQVCELWLVTGG